jgi:hypothetical protein
MMKPNLRGDERRQSVLASYISSIYTLLCCGFINHPTLPEWKLTKLDID